VVTIAAHHDALRESGTHLQLALAAARTLTELAAAAVSPHSENLPAEAPRSGDGTLSPTPAPCWTTYETALALRSCLQPECCPHGRHSAW
jgi:hypothetical protein